LLPELPRYVAYHVALYRATPADGHRMHRLLAFAGGVELVDQRMDAVSVDNGRGRRLSCLHRPHKRGAFGVKLAGGCGVKLV
jgi:hypothetical protein